MGKHEGRGEAELDNMCARIFVRYCLCQEAQVVGRRVRSWASHDMGGFWLCGWCAIEEQST